MTALLPTPNDNFSSSEPDADGLPPAIDAPEPGELPSGTVVGGRYRLEKVLGKGGMGVVYMAHHLELQTRIAVKVLPSIYLRDGESLARFEREARTACRVRHPNVVEVFDLGRLPSGEPYLVMEYLEGHDLDATMARGPLSVDTIRKVLVAIADALDALHAEGIVHRDVKPSNVFFAKGAGGRETVKLVDFGLATTGKESSRLTQVGHVIGTAAYLPPESARGDLAGPAGDVYSLAAMAFEFLSGGALPFDGVPMAILLDKVSKRAPTLAQVTGREFPAALEAIVGQGLERLPSKRPPTARAFADGVIAALDRGALPAVPPAPRAMARVSDQRDVSTERGLASPPTDRRPLYAIAALLLLLGLGGGAWSIWGGGTAATTTPTAPVPAPVADVVPAPPEVAPPVEVPAAPEVVAEVPVVAPEVVAVAEARPGGSRGGRGPRAGAASAGTAGGGASSGTPGGPTAAVAPREEPTVAEAPPGSTAVSESATERAAALVREAQSAMLHGEIPRARDLYREATLSSPRSAAAWRGLGLASERMGLAPEARTAYERYLTIAPEARDADTVRERLEALR